MATQVSPGVIVQEIDLTTVPAATATSVAGIGGIFSWGPIGKVSLVISEDDLVQKYGKPSSLNPETFYSAADFLSYGNALYVSRGANTADETGVTGTLSAVANTANVTSFLAHLVKNDDDYLTKTFEAGVQYIAKYPGDLGNSLKVSVCESSAQFKSTVTVGANASSNATTSVVNFVVGSNTANVIVSGANNSIPEDQVAAMANTVASTLTVGDFVVVGNTTTGQQFMKIKSISAVANVLNGSIYQGYFTLGLDQAWNQTANLSVTSLERRWEYYDLVQRAPGQSEYQRAYGNTSANDELHVVVVDEDGKFTAAGQVLEVFEGLSRATDAKSTTGSKNYYKDAINARSRYVRVASARSGSAVGLASALASSTNTKPLTLSFRGGTNGATESSTTVASLASAYDLFKNKDELPVQLIIGGKALGGTYGETLANYIIANILEVRQDAVGFFSPGYSAVVNNQDAVNQILNFRNSLTASSYAVLDTGYKYRYDKYQDAYIYTPMNGDVAGLCARTDIVRDPWFSPAGFTRGQIKNVAKLAFNPNQAERDLLYQSDVNSIVTFNGKGTVLFGDRTVYGKNSLFAKIGVRRLFNYLKTVVSAYSRDLLFEQNDEFTRYQFIAKIEPLLRQIQSRRGIIDFRVVCDLSNNVDGNDKFRGDIYIKPNNSINFITLNFVAVRSNVEFSELTGQF